MHFEDTINELRNKGYAAVGYSLGKICRFGAGAFGPFRAIGTIPSYCVKVKSEMSDLHFPSVDPLIEPLARTAVSLVAALSDGKNKNSIDSLMYLGGFVTTTAVATEKYQEIIELASEYSILPYGIAAMIAFANICSLSQER